MTSKLPPAPALPSTATPPTSASFKPEIPRRVVEIPGSPGRRAGGAAGDSASAHDTADMRKLIVGRDISLSGEITSCDVLVVEGTVEAKLRDGRNIDIAESGLFKGSVEIDEADIAGRFEGDLTVRGRLRVRASGRINGSIRYGQLEVEAGGRLVGEIQTLSSPNDKAAGTPSAPSALGGPFAKTAGSSDGTSLRSSAE